MEWVTAVGSSSLTTLYWLVGLAGAFAVLAWLSPCNPGMVAWRNLRALTADLLYWFVGPLMSRFARTLLLTGGMVLLFGGEGGWSSPAAQLPLWAQCLWVLVIQDVLLYWAHRLFHTRMAWDFHAVHHSPTALDWMATARFHFVNVLFSFVLADVVVLLMGFSGKALLLLVPFNTAYSALVHANLNWTFGPFRYVLASPVFHRWHHTTEEAGLNKNFASTFPVLDLVFGTYYMPPGALPQTYGTGDPHFPQGFVGQFLHPFRAALRRSRSSRVFGWRRAFAAVTVLALAGLVVLGVAHNRRVARRDDHVRRAEEAFRQRDLDGSIAESTRAIKADPACAVAYSGRGAAALEKGDLQGAIKDCTRAIDLDPTLAIAYANRGGAHLNGGDADSALADCQQALELDPALALAYINRGGARLSKGECEHAVADATRALALEPGLTGAYFTRATAHLGLGQYPEAVRDYTELIQRRGGTTAARPDGQMVLAYVNRGVAHSRARDVREAFLDFNTALRLEPGLAIAYVYRATLSLTLGDARWAAEDYSHAIRLDPNLAAAYWGRSSARSRQGDHRGAALDRQRALELNPSLMSGQ